jgi:hypothetical protein
MPRKSKLTTPLTVRAEKFVANYLGGMTGTEAARAAGYAKPDSAGHRLLQHPKIKALVAEARAKIRHNQTYNLERALQDAEDAAQFAIANKNPMGLVRARELQAKLAGLMVDKIDVQGAPLSINIIGLAAPQPQEHLIVDAQPVRHLEVKPDKA